MLHYLADISLLQLALVAGIALVASIVGGVAGYGSSSLMPLVLVPLLGAEPVVPILSLSALSININRCIAFRKYIHGRKVLIVAATAIPMCIFGAYIYTRLTSSGVLVLIGTMLCLSVPLRRYMKRLDLHLGERGLAMGGLIFGFLAGSTSGAGIINISLLMAAGLESASVVATDAAISVLLNTTKILVFGFRGAMNAEVLAFGVLIAVIGLPGVYLARKFVEALPVRMHTAILDVMVILGGVTMIASAIRS